MADEPNWGSSHAPRTSVMTLERLVERGIREQLDEEGGLQRLIEGRRQIAQLGASGRIEAQVKPVEAQFGDVVVQPGPAVLVLETAAPKLANDIKGRSPRDIKLAVDLYMALLTTLVVLMESLPEPPNLTQITEIFNQTTNVVHQTINMPPPPPGTPEAIVEFAVDASRSFVTRLKTRTTWESHIGKLLTRSDVLSLTGWTKQALSQAVRDHRVLRLDDDGSHAYLRSGFNDESPARPLPGIKNALKPLATADPRGWATASWLMSPQAELGGRTPREALMAGMNEEVALLAEQAAARLAA